MKPGTFDILILMIFPAMMSVGQILFREAAAAQGRKPVVALMTGLLQSPVFFVAMGFYAVATVVWVWLLSRYPLAIAYPIAVLAVVFTPLIDKFFFRQQLPSTYWIGLVLIIAGVLVVVRGKW